MPLFECSKCRVVDNTALGNFWWTAMHEGKPALCTECDPEIGKWHGAFERMTYADYVERFGKDAVEYPAKVNRKEALHLCADRALKPLAPEDLARIISANRYQFADEVALHGGIASALTAAGVEYEREVRLSSHDRADFMAGSIAVEVKIAGSRADVLRQIHRYAQHEQVSAIVLVTRKARHLAMPETLNGKRVVVCSLLEGSF